MFYIVGGILLVIIFLVIGVSFSQIQEKKRQQERIRAMAEKARRIKESFKQQANVLTADGLVSTQVKQKYTSLVNNFFVFQSINEKNIAYLQSFNELFSSCMSTVRDTPVSDELISLIEVTANQIPVSARDFNAGFYSGLAPKLISNLIESIENLESEPEDEEIIVNTEELEEQNKEVQLDENSQDESDDYISEEFRHLHQHIEKQEVNQ